MTFIESMMSFLLSAGMGVVVVVVVAPKLAGVGGLSNIYKKQVLKKANAIHLEGAHPLREQAATLWLTLKHPFALKNRSKHVLPVSLQVMNADRRSTPPIPHWNYVLIE